MTNDERDDKRDALGHMVHRRIPRAPKRLYPGLLRLHPLFKVFCGVETRVDDV